MKYLRKHSTNCSWWVLLVELYQNRSLEIRHQKDPSRSKCLARSRVWDRDQEIPSKLVDLSIKSMQKKSFDVGESNLANVQTFKIWKVENLVFIRFTLIQNHALSGRVIGSWWNFFLHGFYHQDDRVKTIFRSEYPRNISRGTFAPRERFKFLFLDSWSASQKLFRYEDILEPVTAHQIDSWVVFDHFWIESVMFDAQNDHIGAISPDSGRSSEHPR